MARPEGLFGALRLTPSGPPSLRDDVVSRLRRPARASDRLVRSVPSEFAHLTDIKCFYVAILSNKIELFDLCAYIQGCLAPSIGQQSARFS